MSLDICRIVRSRMLNSFFQRIPLRSSDKCKTFKIFPSNSDSLIVRITAYFIYWIYAPRNAIFAVVQMILSISFLVFRSWCKDKTALVQWNRPFVLPSNCLNVEFCSWFPKIQQKIIFPVSPFQIEWKYFVIYPKYSK